MSFLRKAGIYTDDNHRLNLINIRLAYFDNVDSGSSPE
jgi:hypothetical protein